MVKNEKFSIKFEKLVTASSKFQMFLELATNYAIFWTFFSILLLKELKSSICGYFEITNEIETETMTHF
jgi:hypothetical protein